MDKLRFILAFLLLTCSVASATPPQCSITGVLYKADGSLCKSCNITMRPTSTQTYPPDTVGINGITITTDPTTGALPGSTQFAQGERMTVQVLNDKPCAVTIASGGSCPESLGTMLSVCSVAGAGVVGFSVPYDFSYDLGAGVPTASETAGIVSARLATLPANTLGSQCSATAAATSTANFLVQSAPASSSPTTIATLTFGAGAKICTFSTQAAHTILSGDTLTVVAPGSPDGTLAGVRITLRITTIDYP